MKSRFVLDIILIFFLIFIIGLLVSITLQMKEESTRCATDPYKFIIEKLEKANNFDVTCSCYSTSDPAGRGTLYFDKEKRTLIPGTERYGSFGNEDINFSLWEEELLP